MDSKGGNRWDGRRVRRGCFARGRASAEREACGRRAEREACGGTGAEREAFGSAEREAFSSAEREACGEREARGGRAERDAERERER